MSALRGLLRKEVYHIVRDRRTLVVIVMLPVVQVILFGSAIRTDVRHVRLAIVDPVPDDQTIRLRNRFNAAGVFTTVAVVARAEDLEPLFESGRAQEAIVFEPGFADDVARGEPARIGVITDAIEPNTGSLLQAYALQVIQSFQRELSQQPRQARTGAGPARGVTIVPQVRLRFNPTRESSHLFVPGLIAFVLTIISSLMTAISLAREKETGTLEALLVSPLRPWQIIVGKVVPYLGIGLVSVLLVLAEARVIFGVPLRGSFLLLLAESLLFILVSLALGILISSRTASQRVAMMGALVGTMLPNLMLSGFVFPLESMPAALRWVSNVVPGRWFVAIARSIMLKGVGLEYLWRETLVLAAFGALLLMASTRSFKARLE